MLTKVWTWAKAHWKAALAALGVLVAALFAWRKGGAVARGLLGKDKPATPPPGTMTAPAAARAREEIGAAKKETDDAIADARADAHRADDEWLRAGGNAGPKTKPSDR